MGPGQLYTSPLMPVPSLPLVPPTTPGLALYLEEPSKAGEPDLHVVIADGKVTGAGVHDTERECRLPGDGQLHTIQVDTYGRRHCVGPIKVRLQLQRTQAQGWQADRYRHLWAQGQKEADEHQSTQAAFSLHP